ncbi:hypothetical protein D3C87_1370180 [compost metagenome]
MPLELSANVEAAAHRGKPGQGDGGFKREVVVGILAVDAGAVTPGIVGGFRRVEIVQRRFQ